MCQTTSISSTIPREGKTPLDFRNSVKGGFPTGTDFIHVLQTTSTIQNVLAIGYDRVRAVSPKSANDKIDRETLRNLQYYTDADGYPRKAPRTE